MLGMKGFVYASPFKSVHKNECCNKNQPIGV